MLIFKQFVSSEIPTSWESDTEKFRKALRLIKHVRETYVIPARANVGSDALPARPVNTPAPIDTSLRKQAVMCAYCNEADFKHGARGIHKVHPDGFVEQVCFRSNDEFAKELSYTKYGNPDSGTKTRLPYRENLSIGPSLNDSFYSLADAKHFGDYRQYQQFGGFREYDVTDWTIAQAENGEFHAIPCPENIQDFEDDNDFLTERDANEASMYQSETDELGKLERWRDRDPDIHTVTLEEHQDSLRKISEFRKFLDSKPRPFTKEQRKWISLNKPSEVREHNPRNVADYFRSETIFIHGDGGFSSIELLNFDKTRKHHARLLNIFRDTKDGGLRVGGVRVEFKNGYVRGACVKCKQTLPPLNVSEATEVQMEEFVWSIIAHGNNHAAAWFVKRCDRGHRKPQDHDKDCTYLHYDLQPNLSQPVLTDEDEVKFLMEHNSICTDRACACADRLGELVPALAKVA